MGGRRLRADPDARAAPQPADGAACDPPGEGAGGERRRDREGGHGRKSFAFKGLGKLGALGHSRAVAELPGGITVEGQLAWLMWRCIYWAKLPGASRKTKVAVSWLSDLALPAHPVPLNLGGGRGARQAHYEPGEVVFEEGDVGESLFMILAGTVEVSKLVGGESGRSARWARVSISARWRCWAAASAARARARQRRWTCWCSRARISPR